MSTIIRVGEVSFGFDVRDLAFWDEETVILVTPAADVWRAVLDPHPRAVEKLYSGREVNAPLSAAFGKPVEPATGGYPRLAVSARAGVAIVNTHDVVLVACPVGIDAGKPRLISEGWGNYDPQIAFSPDGARFSLMSGGVAVFDTTTWKFGHDEAAGTCVWHPRAPWTLVLDEGRVGWIDWTDVAKPARHSIGTLEGPEDREEPRAVALDPDEGGFLAAYHYPPRLEWWRFDPLRIVHSVESPHGEILNLVPGPAGLVAVVGARGTGVWDTRTREPVGGAMDEATGVVFSPSRRRFITRKLSFSNPYPAHGDTTQCGFDLWQVEI
ncbi:MAG TPA: hypothetical protein VFT45_07990 [Longimicrobium sp.]|nr:hypothetical protein [Longimicrobium sp.]